MSALPDGGTVADLDASGDVVFAVGGWVGGDEFSVAIAGANPMASGDGNCEETGHIVFLSLLAIVDNV